MLEFIPLKHELTLFFLFTFLIYIILSLLSISIFILKVTHKKSYNKAILKKLAKHLCNALWFSLLLYLLFSL